MNTENEFEQMLSDLKDKSPAGISGSLEDRITFLEALMISTLREMDADKAEEIIRLSPHKIGNLPSHYDIQADYYKAVLGK
ncbi:hypothetical protein PsAD5_02147 [Pseudovibrio sp. Ad5]|uniref:hypothetical protein n=1 Tax=Pseudovibrio sp. Ad5 TaxID=989436 RepID=UPI0007B1F207|nr:hypothetical protein [Pseudovibrio sp. Ad5]KZK97908.1 hypothetical protein PsAD5_02147 [Pseudovibrio sp. Ad5]